MHSADWKLLVAETTFGFILCHFYLVALLLYDANKVMGCVHSCMYLCVLLFVVVCTMPQDNRAKLIDLHNMTS